MEDMYGMIHCGMVKDVIFQQLTLVTDMDGFTSKLTQPLITLK